MLQLIVGVKGTGKTKTLIEMVNKAVDETDGSVVCIEKGEKLKFDIKHQARLINTGEYGIANADALYGMVCGLYAENYDITHVFIDSALKICREDMDNFGTFLDLLSGFEKKFKVNCFVTASSEIDKLPDNIKKYITE